MNGVKQYLHDWNDACVYARECLPDLSPVTFGEPWTFLLVLVGIVLAIYLTNESKLKRAPN